jgi:hypothetical protein
MRHSMGISGKMDTTRHPWTEKVQERVEQICAKARNPEFIEAVTRVSAGDGWSIEGDTCSFLAAAECALWRWDGDREHLEQARRYMVNDVPDPAFGAIATWDAIQCLRSEEVLSDADDDRLRRKFVTNVPRSDNQHFNRLPGFQVFNHAVTSASLCDVVARLWPDDTGTAELVDLAESVWQDWHRLAENPEVAPNYEAFHETHLLHWAKRRGQLEEFVANPCTQRWMARGVEHILPDGYIPGFGDANDVELWCDWFGLMCLIAVHSHNGRALSAAERIFGWIEERQWMDNIELDPDDSEKFSQAWIMWWHIGWAAYYYAFGIEAINGAPAMPEPVRPPVRPVVTYRQLPTHDLIRNESWSLIGPEPGQVIPDKAILKTGSDRRAPAVMFGCSRQMWHDHPDNGAINAYTVDGVVLLADSGYFNKLPVDHNVFLASHSDEQWMAWSPGDWDRFRAKVASFDKYDFQVRGLTGGQTAQLLVTECSGPNRMALYQERSLLLARNGTLVVVDRVSPYATEWQGSPTWHVQTIHDRGPGWVETSIDEFGSTQGVRAKNLSGTLYVVNPLSDRPWCEQYQDRSLPKPEESLAYLSHKRVADAYITRMCVCDPILLVQGETNLFATVLVPSWRTDDPAETLTAVHQDAGEQVVLAGSSGLFVMNMRTDEIAGGWGRSDAGVLWSDGEGVFAHRAKDIELPNFTLTSSEMYLDIDLTFEADGVSGRMASEKPTRVTMVRNGVRQDIDVFGIVSI